MSHKRLFIAAAIIAVIIIAGFMISAPHTRDIAGTKESQTNPEIPPVTLKDTFKKGLHTIAGSVDVPNACSTVAVQSSLTGGASNAGILINISTSEDTGICLQVPTKVNFSTTISAPDKLPITATINGSQASTSVL